MPKAKPRRRPSPGRRGRASATKRRLQSPSPLVATVTEAAGLLGISESSVVRMLDVWRDGKLVEKRALPRMVPLRRILIPRTSIADYLAQVANRTGAAS